MDFIRIIFMLLLSAAATYAPQAKADYPAAKYYKADSLPTGYQITYQLIERDACQLYEAAMDANPERLFEFVPNTGTSGTGRCRARFSNVSGQPIASDYQINWYKKCGINVNAWNLAPAGICSGNPPTCTAPEVFDTSTGTCKQPPCTAGEIVSSGVYDGGLSPSASFPNTACQGGCSLQFMGTWPAKQSEQGDGMHYYATGYYEKSGLTCTPSPTNQAPTAYPSVPLSVDQQARKEAEDNAKAAAAAQAAADAAAREAANTAAKAAAAAAAKDAAAKKDAADAARKTAEDLKKTAADKQQEATNINNNPAATQPEKDAANAAAAAAQAAATAAQAASDSAAAALYDAVGQAAGESKAEMPEKQKSLCEVNPELDLCKNSSINAGFCNAGELTGFDCSGDAISCAQVRQQMIYNCKIFKEDTELTTKYEDAKNENGSTSPAAEANIQTFSLPTSLDASSPYSGQCIQDLTVTFNGDSVTLPFGEWCPILEALGWLMLACAYITAAIILGGAL